MSAPLRSSARDAPLPIHGLHAVHGRGLLPPYPPDCRQLIVGMGSFWAAERHYWSVPGVYVTVAGYAGGATPHPSYRDVCRGDSGHAEAVRVVYQPEVIDLEPLLRRFWEGHDPTQGDRQGYDVGRQYRSLLGVPADDLPLAMATLEAYGERLAAAGFGAITTEIVDSPTFYHAEEEHQQLLHKNPSAYSALAGTGVTLPPLRR